MKHKAQKYGRPRLLRLEDDDIAYIKAQVAQSNESKVFVAAQFHREIYDEAISGGYHGLPLPSDVESVKSAFDGAFKLNPAKRDSLPELYYRVIESLYGIERNSLPSLCTATQIHIQNGETTESSATGCTDDLASKSGQVFMPTTPSPQQPVAPQKSLAVLPFVNMSPDQENEFLCDGITEDIIIALSRVKGLRVPARTSSFAFKGKNEDIKNIGKLLNVETVLEGSVRKSGNKLRITAQLVNVNEGVHLWSKRYDREMKDVFDIQDDITRAIVSELQVQLGGVAETQFVRHQTANMTAYELYVEGRVYWNTRGVDLKKALHYFELALLEDPDYSLAWSGIADAYVLLGFYDFLPCREALSKAREAAEKAVALDEQSAEAHSALGVVRLYHDWDLTRAKAELERALQLNAGSPLAHGWLSLCLAGERRDKEALAQARLGVQGDPLSLFAKAHLGWMHIICGQFSEALEQLQHALELKRKSAVGRWLLGQALWFTGDRESALAEFQQAVDLSERNPMMFSSLGWALAQSGQIARAREIQRELEERTSPAPTRPLFLAVLHAALDEHDLAFAALERALAERELWLPLPRAMSGLSLLNSDPRWLKFVRKVEAVRHASSSIVPKLKSGA